jgi:hypothetical protein
LISIYFLFFFVNGVLQMNDQASIKFVLGLSLYILLTIIFVEVASVYGSEAFNTDAYQQLNHNN